MRVLCGCCFDFVIANHHYSLPLMDSEQYTFCWNTVHLPSFPDSRDVLITLKAIYDS